MRYLFDNLPRVATLFGEHLRLTAIALAIALAIAVPLGVLLARVSWLRGPVLSVLGVIYTIPSLSLLVLLIPLFGIGAVAGDHRAGGLRAAGAGAQYRRRADRPRPGDGRGGARDGHERLAALRAGRAAAGAAADPGGRAPGDALDHRDRDGRRACGRRRAGPAAVRGRDHRRPRQDRRRRAGRVDAWRSARNAILRVLERRAALAIRGEEA